VSLLLLAVAAACASKAPKGPSREELTSLLQQEAQAMKATGERLDPVLRVKATWTVAELTVREQPGDADRPWAGTIRFHIRAETRDSASVQVDEFDRGFEYLWSASLRRWLIKPSTP
jgi:hypothetical protein